MSNSISSQLIAYVVISLVCLIPVVALYWIFGDQNYFGLSGGWKTAVATGPIGAYVYLWVYSTKFHRKMTQGTLVKEKETRAEEQEVAKSKNLPLELPNVAGTWRGTWSWHTDGKEESEDSETVEIKQNGRMLTGTIKGSTGHVSKLEGIILNRVVTFYYVSTVAGRLSSGSVTVKVDGDENTEMAGHQVVHELIAEDIESSRYHLQKLS